MAGYTDTVMSLSPIVYWKFEETSGTTATDTSGNGHTGTYAGATLNQPTPLVGETGTGKSILLSGSLGASYVVAAASTAWDTASFTFKAWINPTSGQINKHGIGAVMHNNLNAKWYLRCQPVTGQFEIFHGGATELTGINCAFDVWTFIVLTFDAADNKYRLYRNTGPVNNPASTMALVYTSGVTSLGILTNVEFVVGENGATFGSEEFVGGMDEVTLYGFAESLAQIQTEFAASFVSPITPFKNPTVQTAGNLVLQTTFPIHTTIGPNIGLNEQVALPNPICWEQSYAISTNTAIAIPPGSTSCTIVPATNNTTPITLKGASGDTGIKLAPAQPTAFCVDSAATSFILNSPSPITVQVTFL